MAISFTSPDLLRRLENLTPPELEALPFGIVAMSPDGNVTDYNQAEAALSGLTASRVIGRHFFTSVAPCTNNHLIAQRFESQDRLDVTIDYVFTLRMSPTPVTLRLLKHPEASRMYLVVQRRTPDAV